MEKTVTGCGDCMFCCSSYDDFSMGSAWTHTCNIQVDRSFNEQKSDIPMFMDVEEETGVPITPDWCELKKNKEIIVKWTK